MTGAAYYGDAETPGRPMLTYRGVILGLLLTPLGACQPTPVGTVEPIRVPNGVVVVGAPASAARPDVDVRDPARWVVASAPPGGDSVSLDTWTIVRTDWGMYEVWLKYRFATLQVDPASRKRFRGLMLRTELDCQRHRFRMREGYELTARGERVGTMTTREQMDASVNGDWVQVSPQSTGEQIEHAVCDRAGVANLPVVSP